LEKQKYCKPYLGRYWLYRKLTGGVWRKYGYAWGWYWTRKNLDYACGKQLTKLDEQHY